MKKLHLKRRIYMILVWSVCIGDFQSEYDIIYTLLKKKAVRFGVKPFTDPTKSQSLARICVFTTVVVILRYDASYYLCARVFADRFSRITREFKRNVRNNNVYPVDSMPRNAPIWKRVYTGRERIYLLIMYGTLWMYWFFRLNNRALWISIRRRIVVFLIWSEFSRITLSRQLPYTRYN